MSEPNYASYDGSDSTSSGDDNDSADTGDEEPELIVTTYATFEGNLASAFGTDGNFGQSLGVVFEDIEVIDGCLYADPEKEKFKLFSWQESNDMSPQERLERGEEPSADDAKDFIRKSYAGNSKEYELVAARVPEITDDDGEVLVEASSKHREPTFTPDGVEFSDWTDVGGDTIPFGDAITWWGGSQDHGPSVSSQSLAETLTKYGEAAVVSEDDNSNWLKDSTATNVLRDDLQDERVQFFIVQRDGENHPYNVPIVVDTDTGSRIQPNNRMDEDASEELAPPETGGDSGNSHKAGDQTYPEPLADFIRDGSNLSLDEDRADKLLDDLVSDSDNALTEEMIDDHGGRSDIIQQVV